MHVQLFVSLIAMFIIFQIMIAKDIANVREITKAHPIIGFCGITACIVAIYYLKSKIIKEYDGDKK